MRLVKVAVACVNQTPLAWDENFAHLASEIASIVALLRTADLRKAPSIAESLDWARTLLILGATELTDDITRQTLSVLLKYERDITAGLAELGV